ncbi:acylneuraminate cytidylyltransferase family protein [Octadecabacter sp.]|nr:acylneuraminate cytidylyltransferase family protein [Octadecabacter sp.]
MYSDVLAIIPARGGSKGIPNKNIKSLCGKPLILWTQQQAIMELGSSSVLVSSDSADIQKVANDAGHKFPDYERPDVLATDFASTEPVLDHGLAWYKKVTGKKPKFLMLLQPTSPLRRRGRLTEAFDLIRSSGCDSVLSVVEEHAFHWKNRNTPVATYDPSKRPRRQDINSNEQIFRENGSIYVTTTEAFEDTKCRISGTIKFLQMTKEESYEIDEPTDWLINETLLKAL